MSSTEKRPWLIIFSGLPAAGKTTLSRKLAVLIGATYLRIDSIEQALRDAAPGHAIDEQGYRAAYAIAEDNLHLGRTVIADSVNPCQESRDAWLAVAQRTHVRAIEVEIFCSDVQQHQQRVETRVGDIPGLRLPTWENVIARAYEPWNREHILIDTAGRDVAASLEELYGALSQVLALPLFVQEHAATGDGIN